MNYDAIAFVLYLFILAGVILILPTYWQVSILIALIALVTLFHKLHVENTLEKAKQKRVELVSLIKEKLDEIVNSTKKMRNEFERMNNDFHMQLQEVKEYCKNEIETSYRDLARKILEVENEVSKVKRTLGAGLGALEDRIAELEKMQLSKEEEEEIEEKLTKIFGE